MTSATRRLIEQETRKAAGRFRAICRWRSGLTRFVILDAALGRAAMP
jgi:hypothetical protein